MHYLAFATGLLLGCGITLLTLDALHGLVNVNRTKESGKGMANGGIAARGKARITSMRLK